MIASIWKRNRRAALRNAMRGRRLLLAERREDAVDSICTHLARTPVPADSAAFSPLIYGAATPSAELATRQILYLRFGLYKITEPLFALAARPASRLVYPLPAFWIEALRSKGVRVGGSASRLLWVAAMLALWGYGLATSARLVGRALNLASRRRAPLGRFAHFESIGPLQMPRPGPDERSHDIVTWYRTWPGRDEMVGTHTFRASGKDERVVAPDVVALPLPVRTRISGKALAGFVFWAVAAAGLALLDLARGRWWHALMLHEAAVARFAAAVEPEAVASDYLFNNSNWFVRPLWTYEVERRGARILFYHYSTNNTPFKTAAGYGEELCGWSLSNWPLHLVWDRHNEAFVYRAVERPTRTEIVGPIWFSSSPEELLVPPSPSIALFDVTPFRPAAAPKLALPANYYRAETCNRFILDVARAGSAHGMHLVWKRKRNVGKAAHPAYRATLAAIDAQALAEVIPAEHSPIPVIEAVDAVISMPFTSTAHLARHMGKPSCYYDPTGEVQKDDRAAHDIPILHGYDELDFWIRSLRAETTTAGET